jgi:hypothetical protein
MKAGEDTVVDADELVRKWVGNSKEKTELGKTDDMDENSEAS